MDVRFLYNTCADDRWVVSEIRRMHTVPIEQAPAQITQLFAEAMAGEDVVFTRERQPVLRLSTIAPSPGVSDMSWAEKLDASIGILKGMDTTGVHEENGMVESSSAARERLEAMFGSLSGMDTSNIREKTDRAL